MKSEWKKNKRGYSKITSRNFTQDNTKYQISTTNWTTNFPSNNIRKNDVKEGRNGMKCILCEHKDYHCW